VAAVDRDRIAGLGVCTGGAYMGVAVARDRRIRAYAGVVLHTGSAEASRMLYGGEAGVRERREASRRAMARYRETGEVEYLLAYSNKPGDPTASHTGPMEYYFDASRGYILPWTNKFAVMSWEEWMEFSPLESAPDIRVPTLIIHGDNAALPANARTFFEKIGAREKRLIWRPEPHFDFYDREASKLAVAEAGSHFKAALTLATAP
jgi:pimeloyl-ACP methyl ester carboxylesterase